MRKNKILIVGFRHSGTTLLMNLINHHPEVDTIYNEKDIITVAKDKEWMRYYTRGRFKSHWGDKVPWYTEDPNIIIGKCKKWLKYFRPYARLIHIIRHPIDVALSNTLRNTDPKLVKKYLYIYTKTIPEVIELFNSSRFAQNILFEDLVLKTNFTLDRIYKFCDLKSNEKIINNVKDKISGGIKEHKAFNFKQLGVNFDISHFTYEQIKDRLL